MHIFCCHTYNYGIYIVIFEHQVIEERRFDAQIGKKKHYTLQLNIFQNDDELLLKGLIIILEIFFQITAAGDAIKQGSCCGYATISLSSWEKSV